MIDLNQRAAEVHAGNHRWWHDLHTGERLDRNKGELLMLVISEISEAMEGERKDLMDDHLPHRKMAEVEMADAYIRLLDYAGAFELDLNSGFWYESTIAGENKGNNLYSIVLAITSINWCDWIDENELIAGCIELIVKYCNAYGYDLEGAYQEKMAYNAVRADHQKEARLAPGGKQW